MSLQWRVRLLTEIRSPIKPLMPETPRARLLRRRRARGHLASLGRAQERHTRSSSAAVLPGARRCEISRMTWDELDLTAGVWTLSASRAKNRREHSVPLSDQAVEIPKSLPRGSNFVFSANGKGPINDFARVNRISTRACRPIWSTGRCMIYEEVLRPAARSSASRCMLLSCCSTMIRRDQRRRGCLQSLLVRLGKEISD